MGPFQIWLVKTLGGIDVVAPIMQSKWGWPICESLHFVGLSLLIGAIGAFDLRLLGMGKRIPIAALHRLIPWGVSGYAINVTTGAMFLVTEPDQYIYNLAFHVKLFLMAIAGLNILEFYLLLFRKVKAVGSEGDVPLPAKIVAATSLAVWIGVIVCGRLLTFYRPDRCGTAASFLLTCIP